MQEQGNQDRRHRRDVRHQRPQRGGVQQNERRSYEDNAPGSGQAASGQRPNGQRRQQRHEADTVESNPENKTGRKLTVIGDAYAKTAWLFMYDVLDIGKVYFRMGYHDGDDVAAYADAHRLRVPLHDLFVNGHMNPKLYDVKYKEGDTVATIDIYGGSTREGVNSTIVTITDDPSRRMPISITVSSGPGLLGPDGNIKPKRGSDRKRVSISMSRQEARTMAGQVLGHYAFWEVRRRQYVKPRAKKDA